MQVKHKVIALVAAVGILGTAGTALAADFQTPAQIVAGLTGKTTAQVSTERAAGKTYGTIANEAGKLDQFKQQILDQKKLVLEQRVKDGTMTQAQADQVYNAIKTNQATCDGTGNAQIGKNNGVCSGCGAMLGQGRGRGMGMGFGAGLANK